MSVMARAVADILELTDDPEIDMPASTLDEVRRVAINTGSCAAVSEVFMRLAATHDPFQWPPSAKAPPS